MSGTRRRATFELKEISEVVSFPNATDVKLLNWMGAYFKRKYRKEELKEKELVV